MEAARVNSDAGGWGSVLTWLPFLILAPITAAFLVLDVRAAKRERAAKAAEKRNNHYVNLDGVYGHLRSLRR